MDPFTQKLLERTRARKEYLDAKFAKIPQPTPRKRRSPLKEDNRKSNDLLTSQDDDSPGKRQCKEALDKKSSNIDSQEVVVTLKASVKENRNELDEDKGENYYCKPSLKRQQQETDELFGNSSSTAINKSCTNRLATLAAHINMWEEETQQMTAVAKPRPVLESNSTPPNSSTETLSSSASFKTPSSESSSSVMTSRTDSVQSVSTPIQTPKLKIDVEEFQQLKDSDQESQNLKNNVEEFRKPKTNIDEVHQPKPNADEFRKPKTIFEDVQKPKSHIPKFSPTKHHQGRTKNMVWDQAIVATLESQGFVKSPSKSKLQYNYQKNENEKQIRTKINEHSSIDSENEVSDTTNSTGTDRSPLPSKPVETSRCSVKELAKKFASEPVHPIQMSSKDPAELSLADRVALFEKEAAEASACRSSTTSSISRPQSLVNPATIIEKSAACVVSAPISRSPNKTKSPSPSVMKNNATVSPSSPLKVSHHTFELHRKLFEHNHDWKENEISARIKKEREKDMEVVMNRWSYKNKLNAGGSTPSTTVSTSSEHQSPFKSVPPPPPPLPESPFPVMTSEEPEDSESDAKSEASDISEEEEDSDYNLKNDSDSNIKDDDIQQAVKVIDEIFPSSSEDNGESDDNSHEEIGKLSVCRSDVDFESSIIQEAFTKVKPLMMTETKNVAPPDTRMINNIENNGSSGRLYPSLKEVMDEKPAPEAPLLHTVSFYRRQKESVRLTPVRTIVHQQTESSTTPLVQSQSQSSPDSPQMSDQSYSIQDKIKDLQDEVKAQQIIMGQASQALNLCRSSEFQGSAEEIEGERLLLIAAQRRLACLNEIQRLKTLGVNGDHNMGHESTSKGSLSISDLKLPLKAEFLQSTNMGTLGEFVHFFLCLVKHRNQVIATQMVSTKDSISNGGFSFPNLINIRDLDQDFNIVIELYTLKTKRESIAKQHQKTLASRREKSKCTLTPKRRTSKKDLRMTSPAVQSPGGPGAVCSSSFSFSGFAAINIKTLQRKSWILEECPNDSPLDGQLFMKLQCYTDFSVAGQGFLTMFEDVGGFGAWHRRWFLLSKRYVRFWKYPDDVKRKEPIGTIDLCKCVTPEVGLVPRDICARPNTFMIVLVRPPSPGGENTLVSQSHSSYTSVKIMLSADTKEERLTWCQNLNKALANIRAWEPEALRPMPCPPHT